MKYLILSLTLLLLISCKENKNQQTTVQQKSSIGKVKKPVRDSAAIADSIAKVAAEKAEEALWRHTSLAEGEGVFQVRERMGIDHATNMRVINKLRFEVELINLSVGEQFSAKFSTADTTDTTAKLLEFHYKPNRITDHIIALDTTSDSLRYSSDIKRTIQKRRMLKGTLAAGSSLNQSLLETGLSQGITQVVNGILLCKIAFRTDARVNDSFSVILHEETYKDTIVPSRTKVLYVSYNGNRTGFHEAYRYQDDDPKSTYNAHYTPLGEALVHSGLRYPVDRLHISSGYGWRIHPVTGGRKMHYGVDYAGPIGTPIYAVAPGKVVIAGYDKYSGKKVAIKHADNSLSYYLHLNSRSVSVGQQVRSRQMIGKMGRTGRVTGSHLHFGFKSSKGKWINPSKKRMIATPKLKGDRLAKLNKQINAIEVVRAELDSTGTVLVSTPPADTIPKKQI